ncbi:MAG: hypothetical protein ACOYEA_01805 [Fermentimonas sp.]|jgi:hypothetical protein
MKKIIGIILIIGAIVLGYFGIKEINASSNSVEVLGLEISADDKSGKEMGYVKIGLGIVALIGGVYLVGKKEG